MYNSNTNDFWIVALNFEFAPVGRIYSSVNVGRVRSIDDRKAYNYFLTACRIYLGTYVLCATIGQLLETIQLGRAYLWMVGHYVELLFLCFACLFIW